MLCSLIFLAMAATVHCKSVHFESMFHSPSKPAAAAPDLDDVPVTDLHSYFDAQRRVYLLQKHIGDTENLRDEVTPQQLSQNLESIQSDLEQTLNTKNKKAQHMLINAALLRAKYNQEVNPAVAPTPAPVAAAAAESADLAASLESQQAASKADDVESNKETASEPDPMPGAAATAAKVGEVSVSAERASEEQQQDHGPPEMMTAEQKVPVTLEKPVPKVAKKHKKKKHSKVLAAAGAATANGLVATKPAGAPVDNREFQVVDSEGIVKQQQAELEKSATGNSVAEASATIPKASKDAEAAEVATEKPVEASTEKGSETASPAADFSDL